MNKERFYLTYWVHGIKETVSFDNLAGAISAAFGLEGYMDSIRYGEEVILNHEMGDEESWYALYKAHLAEKYQEDAYNGEAYFPARTLTARERDILCRVISDVLNHCRLMHNQGKAPSVALDAVPIRVGEPEFLLVLQEIIEAITPRRDR